MKHKEIKSYYVIKNKGSKVAEAVTDNKLIFNKYLLDTYGTLEPHNKIVEVVCTDEDLREHLGHRLSVASNGEFMFH